MKVKIVSKYMSRPKVIVSLAQIINLVLTFITRKRAQKTVASSADPKSVSN